MMEATEANIMTNGINKEIIYSDTKTYIHNVVEKSILCKIIEK